MTEQKERSVEKFTSLRSNVLPLPYKDIDTDQIIPADYLTSTSKSGYASGLFSRVKTDVPGFQYGQSLYEGAQIIVSDSNFGCGSSREHAVWALRSAGFRVIIAKSFADIFSNNSAKNGLLLVALSSDKVDELLEMSLGKVFSLEVDLEAQILRSGSWTCSFEYDPFRKYCLVNGLDDLDYLLSCNPQIENYVAGRASCL